MTTKTDLLSTRVPGLRPAIPAANSTDAGVNAMHTDIAAAEDMIDTHAAPPPAKAVDPDGCQWFAWKRDGEHRLYRWDVAAYRMWATVDGKNFVYADVTPHSWTAGARPWYFGPATKDECLAWLGWPKANPDDHGDNGQSARTLAATVERVGTIPTCAACGSPKPTDATGADYSDELFALRRQIDAVSAAIDAIIARRVP